MNTDYLIEKLSTALNKPHVKIVVIYLAISVLWIAFSDRISIIAFKDISSIEFYQLIKSILFVVGTSFVFFFNYPTNIL